MKGFEKKQSFFSFSYIDIFFLLLAGLVLSFAIAFLTELHRENRVEYHQVYLSAEVSEAFSHAIPSAGDAVFGEDGETVGKVLSVETEDSNGKLRLKLKCRLKLEEPTVGEEMKLETPGSIRTMRIDSVEKTNPNRKG